VRGFLLAALSGVVAGQFACGNDHPSCAVTCSAEGLCPEGMVCTPTGFCASPGVTCSLDSSLVPDSPPPADASALPDTTAIDASPVDAVPCVGGDVAHIDDTASGHCYLIFGAGRNWPQARDNCTANGAHLASLSSLTENNLIRSGGPFRWIGLNDGGSEGTFLWVSAEAVTFTNWNGGEPNNDGDEDCVGMLGNGKWNDFQCGDTDIQSVCERP
jgi:hypothetical protein